MNPKLNPETQALSAAPGVTSEQRRLIGVIADKIEDGTLFQSGIYPKKDLARFVRNMLDTTPTTPAASPTPPAEQPDLTKLTERGAKAWAGVDAQALRDGTYQQGATKAAPAGFVPVAAFDRLHAHAESLAARLLAASPTPPAEQQATKETSGGFHVWRDISTAPKDGSRFVAIGYNYGLYSEGRHICVAQWFRGCWMETSDWNEASELQHLTHWLPLPSPPDNAAELNDLDVSVSPQQAAPKAAPHLPERDASLPAERQGLFRKFVVGRVDGSDKPGGKHHGCTYFVLDVDHDPCARPALAAYAAACESTHPTLAADLRTKWGVVPAPQPAPAPLSDDVVRDAARYQWLRRWKGQEHEPPFTVQHEIDGTLWGGDLDAAIDAALAAQGGK